MKTSEKIMMTLLPFLGRQLIRFIKLTMRVHFVGYEKLWSIWEKGGNAILAFWHGRLLMMPYMYGGKGGLTVLISRHKDGELIARTIKGFGIESVRGSSSRGWLGGVKGLFRAIKKGGDIVITPDGPKGPRYKAQVGVINIARVTGLPIMPMSFGSSKKKFSRAGTRLFCHILLQKESIYVESLCM